MNMPVESHNLYGQVMGEMGILGVIAFGIIVALLAGYVLSILRSCKRQALPHPDFIRVLAVSVGQALVLLLLLGWGGHNLYRYNWLWYGAFVILAREFVVRRGVRTVSQTKRNSVMGGDAVRSMGF